MLMVDAIYESPACAALMFALFYAAMLMLAERVVRVRAVAAAVTPPGGRYGAIDGMRGLLAFGVMTHHSITAHVYFTTGHWNWSANPVLNHLGQTTVAIFFMITGFLFTRQCVAAPVDWRRLYIARVARLVPLYLLVMIVLFLTVMALSGFRLHVPMGQLAKELLLWLSFACFGRPDINGLPMTWTLIAGVNWSLKYEWGFYLFGLPLIFAASRLVPRRLHLVCSLAGWLAASSLVFWMDRLHGTPLYLLHFLSGIMAAFVWENGKARRVITAKWFRAGAAIAIIAFGFVMGSGSIVALVAATWIFVAAAGGWTCFGLFATRGAIWLGDISYGIYLCHGLVLWIIYYLAMQAGFLANLNSPWFALLLLACGTCVMCMASLTFILLERPAIMWGRQFARPEGSGERTALPGSLLPN